MESWRVRGLIILICIIICSVSAFSAHKVTKLWIKATSQLNFGYLYPGSFPVTVEPDSAVAGTSSAEILVKGSEWMEYRVILPEKVWIKHGYSAILVDNFTTDLADNEGQLDSLGEGVFHVGATIGPVPHDSRQGIYSGKGIITIYYSY